MVTPTFQLLEKKALPEFRRLFERQFRLGRYTGSPSRKFAVSAAGERKLWQKEFPDQPTTVWFGYAEDPESLESATAKAAWCDEAGQKRFKLGAWEAIQRRLAIHQGRALFTTTPYDLGWLKQQLWDPWKDAKEDHPLIEVVRFDSTQNPVFPRAEWERAKETLPAWKFNLFYRGIFTRPAGLIYDSFKDELRPRGHLCRRFPIPDHWERHLGLDFGNVNTAAVFLAEEPGTEKLYLYRTYHTGGRSVPGHVEALLLNEPGIPSAVGGSRSEDEWRDAFASAGLPIHPPGVFDVEAGIGYVYAAHRQGRILVFDDLDAYREQKMTYSRELDAAGEPLEAIADKHQYHILDAERYIVSELVAPGRGAGFTLLGKDRLS